MEMMYQKAKTEFFRLAGVDTDHSRMKTVSDLVYIATFELDLADAGESTLNLSELRLIRAFVKRWAVKAA